MEYKFSQHALDKMKQRGIPTAVVDSVLAAPGQVIDEDGKKVYQSKLPRSSGQTHLLRVVVSEGASPAVIITVYWTDRIEKYWRKT